jgi:small ligand-binding sensory domain FIST
VRDGQAADEDLRLQLGRYKLARNFAGRFGADPRPAAAVLFSCNGRGEGMYGEAGHDSKVLRESLGADVPIAGFFCNGEIGAVGARGLAPVADDAEAVRSLIHGFTSVVALLYDTSEAS